MWDLLLAINFCSSCQRKNLAFTFQEEKKRVFKVVEKKAKHQNRSFLTSSSLKQIHTAIGPESLPSSIWLGNGFNVCWKGEGGMLSYQLLFENLLGRSL